MHGPTVEAEAVSWSWDELALGRLRLATCRRPSSRAASVGKGTGEDEE